MNSLPPLRLDDIGVCPVCGGAACTSKIVQAERVPQSKFLTFPYRFVWPLVVWLGWFRAGNSPFYPFSTRPGVNLERVRIRGATLRNGSCKKPHLRLIICHVENALVRRCHLDSKAQRKS